MTAPDDCPVHHLDPGETVWIDMGGTVLPYSAEWACSAHHMGVALQPVVDEALVAIDRMVADDTGEPS